MHDTEGWFASPQEPDSRSEAQREADELLRQAGESIRVDVKDGQLILSRDTFDVSEIIGLM